jgi:hypothetical protein
MDINLARSFFSGRALQFNTASRSFSLETRIQHLYNSLPFVTPSSVSLGSLRVTTPLTHEFLSKLGREYDNLENVDFFESSDAFIAELQKIGTPDAITTAEKIRAQQTAFKASIIAKLTLNPRNGEIVSKAPSFVMNDIATLRSIIDIAPRQISNIPDKVLFAHPELCEEAIRKDAEAILDLPDEVFRIHAGTRMAAVERSYFSRLPIDVREADPNLCLMALRNNLGMISSVPQSVQKHIKDEILALINQEPRIFGYHASIFKHFDDEIKAGCLPKVRESLSSFPNQIFDYDVSFLNAHPELVKAAIDTDPTIFSELDSSIQKNPDVINVILPEFAAILSKPEKNADFNKSITSLGNVEIRSFLISKLITCQKTAKITKLPKYNALTDITPIFASSIFYSWGPEDAQGEAFKTYMLNNKSAYKDGKNRNKLLKFMKELDGLAITPAKKMEYFNKCISSAETVDGGLNAAPFLILAFKAVGESGLDELEKFDLDSLKDKSIQTLISNGIILESQKDRFLEVFLASRKPGAIFSYCSKLLADEEFKPVLRRFISNILENKFLSSRHENNSLKGILTPIEKSNWEKTETRPLAFEVQGHMKQFIYQDSESWEDLLLSGTEVMGSCQTVDGHSSFNKCLMGYCLDGKIRILTLKESEAGPILYRSIIKIMKDDSGKPCLFFEKVYGAGIVRKSVEMELKKQAKLKADAMGIPCYEYSRSDHRLQLKSDIVNTSGFEYEDAAVGETITDGRYSVNAKPLEILEPLSPRSPRTTD